MTLYAPTAKPYLWRGGERTRLVLAVTRAGDVRHYARPTGEKHFETLCGHTADSSRTRSRLRRDAGRIVAPDCVMCAQTLRARTY